MLYLMENIGANKIVNYGWLGIIKKLKPWVVDLGTFFIVGDEGGGASHHPHTIISGIALSNNSEYHLSKELKILKDSLKVYAVQGN